MPPEQGAFRPTRSAVRSTLGCFLFSLFSNEMKLRQQDDIIFRDYRIASEMQHAAETAQRGFLDRLSPRRMRVNGGSDILKQRSHLER